MLRYFQTVNFFELAHGQAFSFSRCQEEIIKFCTYFNVIHIKNENCKFLQNQCTDFLVALPLETPYMFSLFALKQRKFTVQKPRDTVQKSGRFSISSCYSNNICVLKESSVCSLTLQVFIIDLLPSAIEKRLLKEKLSMHM